MSLPFQSSGPIERRLISGARIYIYYLGKAAIHTYVSPKGTLFNATHIIETSNQLIMVDAQSLKSLAKDFRSYAQTLGKPIRAIFISHSHPDHYLGLSEFMDIPSFALQSTIDQISEKESSIVPHTAIPPGIMENDGLEYKFTQVANGEAQTQLIIEIPEIDVIIVQDLVYTMIHPFFTGNKDGWIEILIALKNTTEKIVLAGHGHPAIPAIYDQMIKYLTEAHQIYQESSTPEEYKQKLVSRFPEYLGRNIIDLSLKYLYPK